MKIKKVGNILEKKEDKNESSRIQNDSVDDQIIIPKSSVAVNKNYLIGGSVVFVILIVLILFLFVFKKDSSKDDVSSDNPGQYDELKQKELELKERELKLKEKQLSQSTSSNTPQSSAGKNDFESQASDKISEWINSIASRDKSIAYYMMTPEKRGDYSRFTSTKGYGGITGTTLYSSVTEWTSGCYAEVVAYYESIDPYNKNGRYRQRFYINNCSGRWIITEIKNISIENF